MTISVIIFCSILYFFYKKPEYIGLTVFLSLVVVPSFVKIVFSFGSISFVSVLSYSGILITLLYLITKRIRTRDSVCFLLIIICVFLPRFILIPLSDSQTVLSQLNAYKEYIPVFTIIISICYFVHSYKVVHRYIISLYVIITIVCVYGIISYIISSNIYILSLSAIFDSNTVGIVERYMEEERGGLVGRISSTMEHPIKYGAVLSLLFFVFLQDILMKTQKKKIQILKSLFLLLVVVNVFLSGSRGCLVAIFVGLLYFWAISVKLVHKIRSIIIFLGVLFLLGLFPVFGKYQPYINSIVYFWDSDASKGEVNGSSMEMRMDQLGGTIEMISDNSFFLGKGYGFTSDYISKYGNHPVILGFESVLFQGLIEFGVIGFFVVYVLLYSFFFYLNWHVFVSFKKFDPKSYYLMHSYIISYLVILVFVNDCAMVFFLSGYVLMFKKRLIIKNMRLSLLVNLKRSQSQIMKNKMNTK